MEVWSKQNAACSLSFCLGERSYYGTHTIIFKINGNEIERGKLAEMPVILLRRWLEMEGFDKIEDGKN